MSPCSLVTVICRAAVLVGVLSCFGSGGLLADEWYDAYEKGVVALESQQPQTAIEYFQQAIKLRPEPGENVPTTGTRRMPKYYPYLRLAQAAIFAGDVDTAQQALHRSAEFGTEPLVWRRRLERGLELARSGKLPSNERPPSPSEDQSPPAQSAQAPRQTGESAVETPAGGPAGAPVEVAPGAPAPGQPRGKLHAVSTPPGAAIFVDDRFVGETPLIVSLAPGLHTVSMRKVGYAESSSQVRIDAGGGATLDRALTAVPTAAPARPRMGTIVVESTPPGAAVYLDDQPVGETNPQTGRLVRSEVQPGSHHVRISRGGYRSSSTNVVVSEGASLTVRGLLVPEAPPGTPWALIAGSAAIVLAVAGLVMAVRRRRTGPVALSPGGATTPAAGVTLPRAPEGPTTPSGRSTVVEVLAGAAPNHSGIEGAVFGEYRMLAVLGKGGMARVYKAERRGEVVALKRPLPALLEEPEFLRRFLREAEIGRTLHHPNIVRIFEHGDVNGIPYFTMEFIEGRTLRELMESRAALPPRDATEVIVQVAEALDYAHLKGVVHRDLKPSNIMLSRDGTAKVMDYGIARARRFEGMTVTGTFLGTPEYVAPETAEGKTPDGRSDLYSLGVVYYETLTGRRPFEAETPIATIHKHIVEPPTAPTLVNPRCPAPLELIVLRLLRKNPAERYQTAEELLIELRDYLNRGN